MRKLNQKFPIIYIIIPLMLGFFIGYDIHEDFVLLYFGKFAQNMERYTIIISILYIDYLVFKNINYTSIIFRYKMILDFFYKHFFKSSVYIIIFFVTLNIPILFFNFEEYIYHLNSIIPNLICSITISILFISIVRIIDVFIKKRIISSIIFVIVLVVLEVLFGNSHIFNFNYLFILGFVYKFYYFILMFMVGIIILNISICSSLILRKDYMLNDKTNENN